MLFIVCEGTSASEVDGSREYLWLCLHCPEWCLVLWDPAVGDLFIRSVWVHIYHPFPHISVPIYPLSLQYVICFQARVPIQAWLWTPCSTKWWSVATRCPNQILPLLRCKLLLSWLISGSCSRFSFHPASVAPALLQSVTWLSGKVYWKIKWLFFGILQLSQFSLNPLAFERQWVLFQNESVGSAASMQQRLEEVHIIVVSDFTITDLLSSWWIQQRSGSCNNMFPKS